ncbi:short-chain fatty acid transporter [Natrinema salifodinae]|uniref:Short-chain fatty acids transporter n=1 Tax=Natrinema salifodinae TaxID=1202768 RepID=A0A1I0MIU0_9EURY|nr:TIGR00366 family protein [Natrinema salifodinae]SEV88257.1 short-chain fatty acids transporter [Natrinema salifodinae]
MSAPASSERGPVRGFFTRLGDVASEVVKRYLPDAFIFALLLTFLTMVIAVVVTDTGPGAVAAHWGEGFWEVITFSTQSTLALLTGWALADSPPVKRVLRRIAAVPDSQTGAVFVVALCGQLLGLFHWGVVLIAGAILAREVGISMAEKDVDVHYPLLVAAAYAGLLPWHQGLSAASLLLVATDGHFAEETMGVIPVSETIFHPFNLLLVACVVAVVVVLMPLMAPERENVTTVPEETLRAARETAADGGEAEPATAAPHRLRDSRPKAFLLDSTAICVATGLLIWAYLGHLFATEPFMDVLNINVLISAMFGLGFLAHCSLRSYVDVFREAIEGASQIIIQFQFYGGIMGIMVYSGLVELIAETAAQHATETTWYLLVFVSGGVVNFFVPSGGGQWTVMGEIYASATQQIAGTRMNHMLIAFAMGDQWTNMIQPFWAIPVLGIAGLTIRDMMGYVAVLFIFVGVVMGGGALLMGVLG